MKSRSDLLRILKSDEGIARISALYGNRSGVAARQLERYMLLVKKHEDLFGNENCWGLGTLMADDVVIQPGNGFWIKYTNNDQNVNLTFSK